MFAVDVARQRQRHSQRHLGHRGGDEFGVILVQADEATALAKAESLAQAIEASPIEFGDWSAPLHISYGVREITADIEPETLVAEADAAMFAAKRARSAALPIATGGAAG